MPTKIIIIGAGVIGAASALALQKDGHDVLLLDKESPCAGASAGTAGVVINGSCDPTAMPGIIFSAFRMLTQADSPLSVHPAYLHRIMPWLIRFILQSRQSKVLENAKHLHALSQSAASSWKQLISHTDLSSLFKEAGWLKVYESKKSFDHTKYSRELLDKMGSKYECLNASQIQDLEPNLAPIFNHGLYQRDSLRITNPEKLVKGMVELFVNHGGSYKQLAVKAIKNNDTDIEVVGDKSSVKADKVIIAAGAWSRSLAKQLGDNIPLDTERGYHLMLAESNAALLNRPVFNGEDSFVLSPMETGLRMTAQVELAGMDIKPDYSKIRSLLPSVKRMLPKFDNNEDSAWMGFRPSLPDSLPVLGFSNKSNKILYAFGHQHLGMTLGAVSGLLIADLVADRKPPIDLSPYRANRFTTL